jgi:hypothetical protein
MSEHFHRNAKKKLYYFQVTQVKISVQIIFTVDISKVRQNVVFKNITERIGSKEILIMVRDEEYVRYIDTKTSNPCRPTCDVH